jgi:integrase
MAGRPGARTKRGTGSIEKLPSGALRVRVYAGLDPLTKRRHELIEMIQPGPNAAREAEAARVRFVNQINERRNPRTNGTTRC